MRVLSNDCWAITSCTWRVTDIVTVTGGLHNVALLRWTNLHLFIAYVVVELVSLHLVGLVAISRHSRVLRLHARHFWGVLVSIHKGSISLQLYLLDWLAIVWAVTWEIFAPRLVTSLVYLRNFLTNTVRAINIGIHLPQWNQIKLDHEKDDLHIRSPRRLPHSLQQQMSHGGYCDFKWLQSSFSFLRHPWRE